MEDDPHEELAHLIAELETLRADLEAIQVDNLPDYHQFLDELDEVRQLRFESLDRLHDQEIEAAKKTCDGALCANDHDYEQNIRSLTDHIRQVIQFKLNILIEQMPDPVKYFQSHAYETDSPFAIDFCRRRDGPIDSRLTVVQSTESPLSGEELVDPRMTSRCDSPSSQKVRALR
jgi:hypothetical protein